MALRKPHITVCICTYKRSTLLPLLIRDVSGQKTEDLFTFSILIVDNDSDRSAEATVRECSTTAPVLVEYFVEPRQNIALARNKAVAEAHGEYVAFIDDDELPIRRWLLTLFESCITHKAAGVLGPVKPQYTKETPQWVIKGKFYDRPSYPTGFVIDWRKGRTGNVLLKREVLDAFKEAFRPEFRAGEDQDFFRRAIEKKFLFVWCHEALAYETVPPLRWKRSVMLKRALLRGATAALHPTLRVSDVCKSVVAVIVYGATLPLAFVLGQHRFMALLVKLCDHLGKLLTLIGINPIREQYITE